MTDENAGALYEALSQVQAEMPTITKSKTAKAGSYSYSYADISDVLNAIRPVLAKNGLAILQLTEVTEGDMFVRTRLAHKSGQMVESVYPVASIGADHQKMGAALTYARRYGLTALIGVAAEDDMDGKDAATVKPKSAYQARKDNDWGDLKVEIDSQPTIEQLNVLVASKDFVKAAKALPSNWQDELRDYINQAREEFEKFGRKVVPPSFDAPTDLKERLTKSIALGEQEKPFPGDELTHAQKIARTP